MLKTLYLAITREAMKIARVQEQYKKSYKNEERSSVDDDLLFQASHHTCELKQKIEKKNQETYISIE